MRIQAAIHRASEREGKTITKDELAIRIWGVNGPKHARLALHALITGKVKRVNVEDVPKICEALHVDANYLFNVKPMED